MRKFILPILALTVLLMLVAGLAHKGLLVL